MHKSIMALVASCLAVAASGAFAAPPPGSAAPVLVDFESCDVGTACFPQPLDYVSAGGAGQVVDLGGNKVFQLATGPYVQNPDITQAELWWDGANHVPFDVVRLGSHGPFETTALFAFAPTDMTFDVFMPGGGYLLASNAVFGPDQYNFAINPGEWTTIHLGDRSIYGGLARIRGGDVYVDNVSYGRFQSAAPEPASWALLIAGFGVAGGALRNQRRRVTS